MVEMIGQAFWVFVGHVRESAPWLLGGTLIGVALNRWVKADLVERWLQSGRTPVFAAAAAGAVLPGCAMTTMPLAASLRKKGAQIGTLAAFIMIAPILSPQTMVLNLALLGWRMTLGRLILPLLLSVALGLLINRLAEKKVAGFTPTMGPVKKREAGCADCCDHGESEGEGSFLQDFWTSIRELLPYYAIGLFVVSFLQVAIPHELLAAHIRGGFRACLWAALAGIPLYVCDGGEIPLTLALLKLGAGPGPAFTFLLSSVGTCLPTIAMSRKIIGTAATTLYVVAWLILAVGGGMAMEWFYRS